MTFAQDTNEITPLVVSVLPEHIKQTLEQEKLRREYSDSLLNGEGNVCAPSKGYCSSCPVANAVWDLLINDPRVRSVDVDGTAIDVVLSDSEDGITGNWWYYTAPLSSEITNWIVEFDEWLRPDEGEGRPVSLIDAQLEAPKTWPAGPTPFEVTFNNLSMSDA